jgi:hypothetical protein
MATLTDLTLEYLIENYSGDVNTGIVFAKSKYPMYVDKPSKPTLGNNPTSAVALDYAYKLKEYEDLVVICEEQKKNRQEKVNEIDEIIEEFIKDAACLKNVPEKYRDKVYSKAYSDGHSYGFFSVYQKLCELVDIFE